MGVMAATDINRTIDAVWRIEASRLIAGLSRMLRDVGLAEDLAQEALVTAMTKWPETGVPDRPAAWLMATAKRRALDLFRRNKMLERKHAELARELADELEDNVAALDDALDDDVGDDILSLIFAACHPKLSPIARVSLTLRVVGGLSTEEIARAFLAETETIAQRIVRAKRTLAGTPFEVPIGAQRSTRLDSVLQTIYLIFNEGYAATAGEDWLRPQLTEEALRLGRILTALAPDEPEVHGLLALMDLQASRNRARVGPNGDPVLLLEQDRSRWNRLSIKLGLAALDRAESLSEDRGTYTLQAAIAACHARAATPEDTDWVKIAALYAALMERAPSPIVELNRAVAAGMAFGPEVGLVIADGLKDDPVLSGYHLLPAVQGDLLEKLGRFEEAATAFRQAAELARNTRERQLLLDRVETVSSR